MIAFFDASALIYLTEGREPFATKARESLRDLASRFPGIGTAVSRLSWLECRVGPMRSNDATTLARYDAFFAREDIVWIELTREVIELAAAIRARHGLRTPDALQAACCLQLGQEHLLLSGDSSFGKVTGLNAMILV